MRPVDAAKKDDVRTLGGPRGTLQDGRGHETPEGVLSGYIERRYAMARAYLDSPPVRLLDAA